MKKTYAVGLCMMLISLWGLSAGGRQETPDPLLTEEIMVSFIQNQQQFIADLGTFYTNARTDMKTAQWIEDFHQIGGENPAQIAAFLKKNPAPQQLQELFKQYGFDGETGILQMTVIIYGFMFSIQEEALAQAKEGEKWKGNIHPDDLTLIKKHQAELMFLLQPVADTDAPSNDKEHE